ncbi:hypothetical protein F1D05_22955 [Kribbella qitaiheensis]|uniref:DUF3159 domain-containing protein n=1 Tax=Kribbella qitaiheensis TaxID=1544730 RepID=A0A7G6X1Y3_9ACTN|nr:hypothetical protein [Kribbella qitaiheensis]QNE20248.1 hypothetical protein F1D05_22955 [Kribbella qitaiheensis]
MSYLRTFAPWIVYAVIPSAHWNWAALIALVLSLGLIAQQTRAGRTLDAQIIELGSAVFFAVITVVAFTSPHSALHPYTPALSSATLAVIAGVSLALRKPFTLGIAKQTTPREIWNQPLFVRTNVIITAVWTACFAVTAAVLALLADGDSTARTLVQIAGFVVPMVFTLRYVAHIQAKAAELQSR